MFLNSMTNTHTSIVSIKNKFYLIVFLTMSIIYAFFSSPSPSKIGLYEILIALCLVVLTGFIGSFSILGYQTKNRNIPMFVSVSALSLVVLPTITGLFFSGNEISDYIRDIIPMLYLTLPVLLFHRVKIFPSDWVRWVVSLLCVIGLVFSIRQIIESDILISSIGNTSGFITQSYFILDPSVFFTATFLTCYSVVLIFQNYILKGLALLALSIIPWIVILSAVSRSAIILISVALFVVIFLTIMRSKSPISLFFKFSITVAVILPFFFTELIVFFGKIWTLLIIRHELIGVSGRVLEAQYVVQHIDNVRLLLLGEGWGGLIDSPLLSDQIRFTHNSFTYFLFKSGVVGLMTFVVYLYFFILKMFSEFFSNKDMKRTSVQAAIIVTLIIHLLLEAGYKSITMGIIFLLMMLLGMKNSQNFIKK
jgi:hypothetical protein